MTAVETAQSRDSDSGGSGAGELKALGLATVAGVAAVAVGAALITRHAGRSRPAGGAHFAREALKTYLIDHLTGTDTAFRVVDHLRNSEAGTPAGELFSDLYEEFRMERSIVEAAVSDLGGWNVSPKRLIGKALGGSLQ